ncbi:hypothetical protein SDC9_187601 [bioreactor metagenome]|uniref:Uncharacterized protein n=1 Tax=bioreactor metagenome TaxID=1076179 RepID=A0A645HNC0_9ZZZZ
MVVFRVPDIGGEPNEKRIVKRLDGLVDMFSGEYKTTQFIHIAYGFVLPGVCDQQTDGIREIDRLVVFTVCKVDLNHIYLFLVGCVQRGFLHTCILIVLFLERLRG